MGRGSRQPQAPFVYLESDDKADDLDDAHSRQTGAGEPGAGRALGARAGLASPECRGQGLTGQNRMAANNVGFPHAPRAGGAAGGACTLWGSTRDSSSRKDRLVAATRADGAG